MKCQNCCMTHVWLPNVCIPAALLAVRLNEDDEAISLEQRTQLLANLNTDWLWNDLDPIIDGLEAGHYNLEN